MTKERLIEKRPTKRKRAVLVGVAGSFNAFSLSLYNLKAFAYSDPNIKENWDLPVIQHPLINQDEKVKFDSEVKDLADRIIDREPDLVVFSCYMWNVKTFQEVAKQIVQKLPSVLFLWGGPEMSRDYILEGMFDDFDAHFIISGEGEKAFQEILSYLTTEQPSLAEIGGLSYRQSKNDSFQVNEKRTPFKSLLEVPSPYLNGYVDDEVLIRKEVEANIESQRGCSLRCAYCVYNKDMGRISYSTPQRVIEEVLYVCHRGVKRIRFVDANFSSNLDHAKAIMRGLIEYQVEARIMFELIPGFIDEELASLFSQFKNLHDWNDLTIGVGVQTINYEVLRRMKRGIRLSAFEKTFDLFEKYGIYAKIDLIIGLPGEDIKSIERTLEYFLDRLRNSQAHLLCCHHMRGLPGTDLLNIAKEYGMVFSSEREPHELIESPILPRQDMLKCLRRTAVVFRLVNHKGWANKEFVSEKRSSDTSIRDTFFETRDRLGISNVELIDLMIEKLMPYMAKQEQNFAKPDFPYAETWWWTWSRVVVSNKWLIKCLNSL